MPGCLGAPRSPETRCRRSFLPWRRMLPRLPAEAHVDEQGEPRGGYDPRAGSEALRIKVPYSPQRASPRLAKNHFDIAGTAMDNQDQNPLHLPSIETLILRRVLEHP